MKSVESSFPRGSKRDTNKTAKKVKKDNLFQLNVAEEKSVSKKRKIGKNLENTPKDEESVVLEAPNFQIYGSGMAVLGCIKHITDLKVTVELPGGLFGTIPVTGISQKYTEIVKKSISNPEREIPNLDDILSIGQLMPCSVTMVGEDPETKRKSISLSIDPCKVNSNLSSSLLRHGMVLSATISEVEDHGFVMDLGISGVKAFLKNEECEAYINQSNSESLHVGQVIQCMIDISDKTNPAARVAQRVVNLTVDPEKVKAATMKAAMNINLHALVPGMLLPCTICKIVKDGVIIKSLQYDGCVPKIYLKSPLDKPINYTIDEKIFGRLMYIHPLFKTLYVTFNQYIVETNEANSEEIFGDYGVGDIENAIVMYTNKNGVTFNVNDKHSAFCKLSNLSDENVTDIMKNFPIKSSHKCRLIGFSLLNTTLIVSLKKSVLEQAIFVPSDIKPGELHRCEVVRLVSTGLIVRLSSRVLGFVPSLHLSDVNLKYPEKHFQSGKKIKCRVLSVQCNEAQTSIKLSHKTSIIKTTNDLITDFDEVKVGQISDGVIIFIAQNKLVVSFYNNITGIINSRNFGIGEIENVSEAFQKGQVVRCQVIKVDKDRKKLFLSLKIEESGVIKENENYFETGKLVNVKVVSKTHNGINVNILPNETPAFIPIKHLSDHLPLCKHLYESYQEGTEMQAVYFLRKHAIILSRKLSLMEAAKSNEIINYFSDVKIGMNVVGVISNIVEYGMFIQLSKNLSGLAPQKKVDICDLTDCEDGKKFEIDQAVVAKVTDIKVEKKQIELSLKLKDVYSGEVISSVNYLESYLAGLDQVLEHYSNLTGEKKEFSELRIGSVVPVTVTKKLKSGFTGMVRSNIPCICTNDHCEDVEFKKGDTLSGVVLFMDVENCSVQVLVLPSVVKRINDFVDNWHSKANIDQRIKCDVLLAHEDYILVILRGHANGRIAFLPNKKHLNDNIGRTQLFTLFHTYPISVQRIVNDKCIVTLNAHESRPKLSNAKKIVEKRKSESDADETPSKRKRRDSSCSDISLDHEGGHIKKHDLILGNIYNAVVKSVKTTQLNINVNGKVPGRIHVTEASDQVIEGQNPLDQFKVGQNIKVRIIGFRQVNASSFLPITHKNFTQAIPECSAKESIIYNDDYKVEAFEEELCAGQEVVGYFKRLVNSYLWFKLTPQLDGKLYVLNFSDDPKILAEVESLKPGSAFRATIISVGRDFVQLTRTETQQIKEGTITIGKILSTRCIAGALVRLPHGYRGYLDLTDISDAFTPSKIMLENLLSKMYVRCCLLEVNHTTKECVLSTRHSRTKRNFRKAIADREVLDISDITTGDVLRGFVTSASKRNVVVKLGRRIDGHICKTLLPNDIVMGVGLVVDVRVTKIHDINKKIDLELMNIHLMQTNTSLSQSEAKILAQNETKMEDTPMEVDQNDESKRLGVNVDFTWSNDLDTFKVISDDDPDSDSESESEEDIKKRKRRTAKREREEEAALRKKELSTLQNEQTFETVDEFERASLSCPNSSIMWINWMAFHLEKAELDKARGVAEKALKTISFREEVEKYNVWISYLNLENMYGTAETLKDALMRAAQECDQMKIYQALINIYCTSDKVNEAETLYNVMLKKFNQNKQVWIDFGLFLIKHKQFEKARNLMQRSLKNVQKRDHLDILSQFAQSEMKFGDVERGKTMFDNILSSYPKKTNLWAIYIDLLTSHGDIDSVRQVLDHALTTKLPTKTMKFFFKRYIAFEKQYGTPASLEEIKQKVVDFVDSESI